MKNFSLIPVLDLLNSKAVHAIKGDRENYRPVKPVFLNSSDPVEIAIALKQKFNFEKLYVADLNAIMKNGMNLSLIKKLHSKSSLKIILDPGISNSEEIRIYLDNKIEKLILGLETINDLETIDESLNLLGKDNVIISIDMYNKKIISQIKRFKNQAPEKLISVMNDLGVKNILLLDLYRVGQKYGGIPPLYLKMRDEFRGKTFVGGGIKDIEDVMEYKNQNFSGVLVGTALLDGTISKKEIEKLNNLLY